MRLRPRRPARPTLAAALARAAPFVLGAVAAGVWLRRRQAGRPALPERAGVEPPPVPPAPRRPGRFARAGTGRFQRGAIDIVTVVDDLLGAPR